MNSIAQTPPPPYYAVIFTSLQSNDLEGYAGMADEMVTLAEKQPGFLGFESARSGLGISVSYWRDEESIANWKRNTRHQLAQRLGREQWYDGFCIRVCRVERAYGK